MFNCEVVGRLKGFSTAKSSFKPNFAVQIVKDFKIHIGVYFSLFFGWRIN